MRHTMMIDEVDRVVNNEDGDEDEDGNEDELAMPMIISDVLQQPQAKTKKTMSSMMVGSPRTPGSARTSQQTSAEPSQSPSQMRLAVHIRSSPVRPFTPINAPTSRDPSTLPSRLSRAREQTTRSETPTGPPVPEAVANLVTKAETSSSSEPKKRGRPKGWKPGMRYSTDPNSRYRKREMRALESRAQEQNPVQTKNRGQPQEGKRRGRPPRPPEPTVQEWYLRSKPEYTPYKCEWDLSENSQQQEPSLCPAELQNMDTLRRHVFLVHGDRDPLVCRFSHCRDHNPPLRFRTEKEFESHMETKHFASYLWHFGDGCRNEGVWTVKKNSDQLPTYLFDEHGNQVTPSVKDQRLETDVQHKERRRKLRKLLYQQNENAPSEEEWMKQMLGIA
ncbi:hypothetical protein ANO14919_046930 [Xylariales sp. No.14919]|nr:hypothetical protein ANO14919_046930 [Xylariales sp. No.14919]